MIGIGFGGVLGRPGKAVYLSPSGGNDVSNIQAKVAQCLQTGYTLVFTKGYYTVDETIHIGLPEVDNWDFLVNRTSFITDTIYNANDISANETTNDSYQSFDIVFEVGAWLVADWTPTSAEPVISYNINYTRSRSSGAGIYNAYITTSDMLTGGVHDYNAVSTPQSNNLIGIFANNGVKVINRAFISGCEHGIVGANNYWSRIYDCQIQWAGGDAVSIGQGNAMVLDQIVVWNSNRGVVFDGDASSVTNIHTEGVAEDLVVFSADCCNFGPAYFEDLSGADGTGLYSVTLGVTEDGTDVKHSTFFGLRTTSQRPNKEAFRVWSARACNFIGCRAYGETATPDTDSYGALFNCDFTLNTNFKLFDENSLSGTPDIAYDGTNFIIADLDVDKYLRLGEVSTTSYRGAYLRYDNSGNRFYLGTHANNDAVEGNDTPAISIPRGSANVGFLGDRINVATQATPASASASGTKGDIVHDTNFIYICTATNTWKRIAIATW